MSESLFLCHRLPYPPNKGDKIVAWRLFNALRDCGPVHLGTFIDDPADLVHQSHLRDLSASSCIIELSRTTALRNAANGLLTGAPLSVAMLRNQQLQSWVDALIAARPISHIVCFSAQMAPYAFGHTAGRRSAMAFCDVDSQKWRDYAAAKPWPMSWVYRREARTLHRLEAQTAAKFDHSIFVTPDETALFQKLHPDFASRARCVPNGVDFAYFDPMAALPSVEMPGGPHFVFTGAMDYWANVDAVVWFAQNVWPALRQRYPGAGFWIVGGKPTPAVQALATQAGIYVTGRVDDVRPYVQNADVVVAPLRIARGVQNKVLEGMAMAKPVVATTGAFVGIDAEAGRDLLIADTPDTFLDACVRLLGDHGAAQTMGQAARQRILTGYDWARSMNGFKSLLDLEPTPGPALANEELLDAIGR